MGDNELKMLVIGLMIYGFVVSLGWINAQRLAMIYRKAWAEGKPVVADKCKCGERNCPICFLENQ